jgi:hypothetical protein
MRSTLFLALHDRLARHVDATVQFLRDIGGATIEWPLFAHSEIGNSSSFPSGSSTWITS